MRITIEQTSPPSHGIGMSITKLILETDDDFPSFEEALEQIIIPLMSAYGYDTRDLDEVLYPTAKPQGDEE